MRVSSKVTAAFKQVPIADYLAARFTYRSLDGWRELVSDGRVFCNDLPGQADTLVTQGDVVACDLPDFTPASVNFDYTIIYEDEWLLGINKPAGLRVHSLGKFVTANLMYHLRYQHQPPYPEAQLVNRLDAHTSGVVVVAQDKETVAALARQFERGQVVKTYLAVVVGAPAAAERVIDLPIGKVAGGEITRYGVVEGGKTAVTHYRVLQTFGREYALLELRPHTGRTHQLRVHLAALGHRIVGDALYAMDDAAYLAWRQEGRHQGEMALIARQALHCAATELVHPANGRIVQLTAPLPADMIELLGKLQRP
mgnify:CR=1 FL=1